MPTYYYGPKGQQQVVLQQINEIAYANQQAGEAVVQYDIIYRNGQVWLRADASGVNSAPVGGPFGMAQNAAGSGNTLPVWIRAIVSNGSWNFVSGLPVWLGSGPGNAPIQSAPIFSGNVQLRLGWAPTPTSIDLNPQTGYLIAQSG